MDLDVRIEDDTIHIKISDAIDTEGGSELTAKFMEFIEDGNLSHALFDLSDVPTITSAGIGKLLKFYKHFDGKGGSMKITAASESLKKQFEEIHLDQIIPVG